MGNSPCGLVHCTSCTDVEAPLTAPLTDETATKAAADKDVRAALDDADFFVMEKQRTTPRGPNFDDENPLGFVSPIVRAGSRPGRAAAPLRSESAVSALLPAVRSNKADSIM